MFRRPLFSHFLVGTLVAVVTAIVAQTKGNVQVLEGFFKSEDIQKVIDNKKLPKTADWNFYMAPEMKYDASYLDKEHINRFFQAMNDPRSTNMGRYIPVKTMTKTTVMHKDTAIGEGGKIVPAMEGSAFIFMNSNPHASFVVEGEDPIPVKEGTLVAFPGGQVKHKTVIKSGHVELAGPFSPSVDIVFGASPQSIFEEFFFVFLCPFLAKLGIFSEEACIPPFRRKLAQRWLRAGLDVGEESVEEVDAHFEELEVDAVMA